MLQVPSTRSLFQRLPATTESTGSSPCWPWKQQDPNYNTGSSAHTRGHAYNINVEEAQAQPATVMDTLLINSIPSTVLFDTRASHSFMSEAFALSHNFTHGKMDTPMVVRTPKGQCRTTMM